MTHTNDQAPEPVPAATPHELHWLCPKCGWREVAVRYLPHAGWATRCNVTATTVGPPCPPGEHWHLECGRCRYSWSERLVSRRPVEDLEL